MRTRTSATGESVTRKAVRILLDANMPIREIAAALGFTPQAIRKHEKRIRTEQRRG